MQGQDIPHGLCECGCGESAPLAKCSNTKKGYVKGQPMRFVHGHHLRVQTNPMHRSDVVARLSGDNHYSRTNPEKLARGERSGLNAKPWRRPYGDRNGSRKHPERYPRGENHPHWKGDEASYGAIHLRLRKEQPLGECQFCGVEAKHLALIHGRETHYQDGRGYSLKREDYLDLCPRCHGRYDWTQKMQQRGKNPAFAPVVYREDEGGE